ncbi:hypothetical protein GCM10022229_17090 [Luteimonas lutimaris]|uniref:HEPN domain-containing protein n=1 Tax=Luteimonas lutimaris TaxID=698645 RepID=A0ABP7MIH0_9GAMM
MLWIGDIPAKPNMATISREMCTWLQRKTYALPLFTKESRKLTCQVDNPYTFSLGSISFTLASTINDAWAFSESAQSIDPVDAEVMRIRLESELSLNVARFCEAAIKQLLYCTSFPNKHYKSASLQQLLAKDCEACRKSGGEGHDVSLLGALAHRYFLCLKFDHCAFEHLKLVARRRNAEAAHANSPVLNPRDSSQSRADLKKSLLEIGHELGHMADHISEVEEKMFNETKLFIGHYPNRPPHDELAKVPIRPLWQYYPELLAKNKSSTRSIQEQQKE